MPSTYVVYIRRVCNNREERLLNTRKVAHICNNNKGNVEIFTCKLFIDRFKIFRQSYVENKKITWILNPQSFQSLSYPSVFSQQESISQSILRGKTINITAHTLP